MEWPVNLIVGISIALVVALIFYILVLRRWHMSWGATPEEFRRPLPGDDLVARPLAEATHAITIKAPAAEVWPWLVQMGQGRGGFYSYHWLENLFGCRIVNADRIHPEWQALHQGDGIRLHAKAPELPIVILEPGRSIVLGGGREVAPELTNDPSFLKLHRYRAYTWAFVLDEKPDGTTRFLARVRGDWDGGPINFFRNRVFMEPAHSIMQEKMNRGLKKRVEAARR